MLANDGELRWWGMDMRPRWRRRVAVGAGYAVLFFVCELIGGYGHSYLYWRSLGVLAFSLLWTQGSVLGKSGVLTTWMDERERRERDSAERWTLDQLATYLASFSGLAVAEAARHHPLGPMEIAVGVWLFCMLARTLPRARVLWTEADPRLMSGELALVASAGSEG
jgi:hypothetical protein